MSDSDLASSRDWIAPDPEVLAQEIPSYDVQGILAQGGMAAVYAGMHRALERKVAIKVLPARLSEDSELDYNELFIKEARAMAKLSHPGIVQVHDFGATASGNLFLILEYVDGMNVEELLQRRAVLSPEEAGVVTRQVCDALTHAHKHGLLHGDVKPANILVDHEGKVHLTDLGLARRWEDRRSAGRSLGTPGYAAPELYGDGADPDPRIDVYALGATLFEMLTGRPQQGPEEAPSAASEGLSPAWDSVVVRATSVDPDTRYPTPQDFRVAVDHVLNPAPKKMLVDEPELPKRNRPLIGAEALPTVAPRRRKHPLKWILVAIIVVCSAIILLKWRKEGSLIFPWHEDPVEYPLPW